MIWAEVGMFCGWARSCCGVGLGWGLGGFLVVEDGFEGGVWHAFGCPYWQGPRRTISGLSAVGRKSPEIVRGGAGSPGTQYPTRWKEVSEQQHELL